MTDVDRLLARLRSVLGRDDGPPASGEDAERRGPEDDASLAEGFRDAFRAAGGIVIEAPSPEAALPALAEILQTEGVKGLLAPENDGPAAALALALVPFGPFSLIDAGELRAGTSAAAGFQTATYAVAETGTLVQTSADGTTLLPGLLPEVHVALVPAGRFFARMEDALAAVRAAGMPRNVSFMTGPSRTGDIEQTLVVGAHGPRKVVALLTSPGI